MADSVATKPVPSVPTAKPRATVPAPRPVAPSPADKSPDIFDDASRMSQDATRAILDQEDSRVLDAVATSLPPAQTAADLEREVELRLHDQLHFISICPPDTMTVNDFADYTKQSTSARAVLDQYIEQGWVARNFRQHYGRYSLTPAGLDYLVELARKHDLPQ